MRHAFALAGKPLVVIAVWLAIGWLSGYLRPLDASLGVELPAWVQVPGVVAVVAGAALVLVWRNAEHPRDRYAPRRGVVHAAGVRGDRAVPVRPQSHVAGRRDPD